VNINRRHKVGFFLVLVASALALFLDAPAKPTVGFALLGVAAIWLLGSISLRTLGFLSCSLACAAGLCILVYPVWQDWNSYKASVQEYDSAISKIIHAVYYSPRSGGSEVKDSKGVPLPGQFAGEDHIQFPEELWEWRRPDVGNIQFTTRVGVVQIKDTKLSFPAELADDEILDLLRTKIPRPRPTFSISGGLFSHHLSSLGIVLLVVGLVGFELLRAQTRKSRLAVRALK
jgi:hypothetical protein